MARPLCSFTCCSKLFPQSGELGRLPDAGTLTHAPTFSHTSSSPLVTTGLGASAGGTGTDAASSSSSGAGLILHMSSIPGIPAIPQKLSQKILAGDYVEMAELRPDSWRMEELLYLQPLAPGQCPASLPRPRKKPVTDILTWVECFSVMAAMITSRFPDKAPQLFAYLRMIVRASQTFEGPAWVSYDSIS